MKKVTLLLLVVIMMIGLFPVTAMAATLPAPEIEDAFWASFEDAMYVVVMWTGIDSRTDDFVVQYSRNGGSWKNMNTETDYIYWDKNYDFGQAQMKVTQSGSYKMRVAAVDGSTRGTWAYSSSVSVRTNNMDPITGFKVSEVTRNSIKISWNKVTDADRLYVSLWAYNTDYNVDKQVSKTSTSYTFTGLQPDTKYWIQLQAYEDYSDGMMITSVDKDVTTDSFKPVITSGATFNKTWGGEHAITVETKFAGDVTVRIANANGNTVKNIEYNQPYSAGTHTVKWDGTDTSGNLVPNGTYTIVAIESDSGGTTYYSKKALTFNIVKAPQITSNSKYPKTSNNKHLIKFSITQDTKVSIVIRDAAGKSIRYIANKSDFNAGQHNVYWDGKDSKGNVVPSGLYYIYGIQYDEDGKYTYTKKKLAVEISEKPTITSNSYYTRTGTNRHLIKVDIATPALVSTVIKDGNLKSVIYLEYKASHQDGKIYLYWDGKDKSGNDMPDGIYYIYAIQYKDDGSYTYTRKKLVLN